MRTFTVLVSLLAATACGGPPPGKTVSGRTLDVGCGTCMFKQLGGVGCYWAAQLDGETYPMRGTALPTEAELPSHGPEGMCSVTRRAVVDGQVTNGLLMVSRFELLPLDPDAPRAPVHDHVH